MIFSYGEGIMSVLFKIFFSVLTFIVLLGTVCEGQSIGSYATIYFTTDGRSSSPSVIPSGFDPNTVWDALGSTWDGHIYTAISDHKMTFGGVPGNTAVFHWDPYRNRMTSLGTVKQASQRANNWLPMESQEKIHCYLVEIYNGEIWMATHDNSDDNLNRWHRGSHWYAVDNSGELVDKSKWQDSASTLSRTGCTSWRQTYQVYNPKVIPTESTGIAITYESIMGIGYNPQAPYVIYGSTYPRTFIVKHDLINNVSRVVGSGRDTILYQDLWTGCTRQMIADKYGNAYCPGLTIFGSYQITKYDYRLDSSYVFQRFTDYDGGPWSGCTQTWSGESLFVSDHGGKIYGLYPGSDRFEQIVDMDAYCRNLVVSRDAKSLYTIPEASGNVKKINIATGSVSSFGNIPTTTPYGNNNTRDTLGWAYYAYGSGSNTRLLKVYLGKNELGPYKKPEYAAIMSAKNVSASGPELRCFPNPFSTNIEIQVLLPIDDFRFSTVNAGIYDIQGQLVAQLNPIQNRQSKIGNSYNWHAASHAPGVYFVTLKTDKRMFKKKIILMR
jgi:hypothetical protein